MRLFLLSVLSFFVFTAAAQQASERAGSKYKLDLSRPWDDKPAIQKRLDNFPAPVPAPKQSNITTAPLQPDGDYVYNMPVVQDDREVMKNMPIITPDSSLRYTTPVLLLDKGRVQTNQLKLEQVR